MNGCLVATIAVLMSTTALTSRVNADEARPDVVVVAHGDASLRSELLALADAVAIELRKQGHSLLRQPVAAFEMLHSRDMRRLDTAQLRGLGEALFRETTTTKDPTRLADLAHAITDMIERAPEAYIDDTETLQDSVRYVVTQACFEGIRAYQELDRLPAARSLIERCAGLTWLVASERLVRPDVRDILLRDVRQYDLQITTVPRGRRIWLQGAEFPGDPPRKIRTRPGVRLPAVVDCGTAQRTHWVDVPAGKSTLRVNCAFDNALHTDERGFWLTSNAQDAGAYALEIARVVRARNVLLVGKAADSYKLRALSASERRSPIVSVPLVHSDRQLAAAVGEVVSSSGSSGRAPGEQAAVQRETSWRENLRERRMVWSGGIALGLGLGGELAGWLLYRKRSEVAEELYIDPALPDGSPLSNWHSTRVAMLGVGAAASAVATTGTVLLAGAPAEVKPPWWLVSIVGGAGAGLAAWGIVDLAKGDGCEAEDARPCLRDEQQRDRGALLILTSVPMVALPLAKALRLHRGRADRVQLGSHGAIVTARGSW